MSLSSFLLQIVFHCMHMLQFVYSFPFGGHLGYFQLIGSSWLIELSKSTVSLLIFCVHDLSIIERGVLQSPITNVISLFVNCNFLLAVLSNLAYVF